LSQDKKQDRREFLANATMGTGLFASAAILLRHGLAFIFPENPKVVKRKLLVGRVDELKEGEAKEIKIGERNLFLVKVGKDFKVFSAICTHLGCKIKWQGYRERFYCACHQGIFSANGDVIGGPPPRPLDEFKVEVENNLVYMTIDENDGGLA
jgi:cytochrome b6-f complex iron-sulfur subunit